jgi:hypothetical protein
MAARTVSTHALPVGLAPLKMHIGNPLSDIMAISIKGLICDHAFADLLHSGVQNNM